MRVLFVLGWLIAIAATGTAYWLNQERDRLERDLEGARERIALLQRNVTALNELGKQMETQVTSQHDQIINLRDRIAALSRQISGGGPLPAPAPAPETDDTPTDATPDPQEDP